MKYLKYTNIKIGKKIILRFLVLNTEISLTKLLTSFVIFRPIQQSGLLAEILDYNDFKIY
jgi:hypothetical protein